MTTTTTARRSDSHAPASAEFDPQAYDFVFYVDLDGRFGNRRQMNAFLAPMFDSGFSAGPHWGNAQCGHCGAHLRYAAVAIHADTMEIILIGEQCLENRFGLTKPEFQALREAAKLNRERTKKEDRIARMIENDPDLVWITYVPNIDAFNWSDFMGDMFRALVIRGDMSPAQRGAALRSMRKVTATYWEREAERIAREAASATKVQAHIGNIKDRITVMGRITQIFQGTPFAYYGPVPYTFIVETDAGMVKFSTTSETIVDHIEGPKFSRDDVITVTGTVKAHATYRDTPQTILTRVKAL
jgi:hypothetical protein